MRAQLETFVEYATASTLGAGDGLPVFWRHRKSGWRQGDLRAHALLFLSAPVTMGRDDYVYEEDLGADPGEEITFYQVGQRAITLQCQIGSHSQEDSVDALEYTYRVRNRILLPSLRAVLKTGSLAFQRIALHQDLSEVVDDRDLSIAQIDIVFNASSLEASVPTGYIATVEAETNFLLPSGDPAPEQWSGNIEVG